MGLHNPNPIEERVDVLGYRGRNTAAVARRGVSIHGHSHSGGYAGRNCWIALNENIMTVADAAGTRGMDWDW